MSDATPPGNEALVFLTPKELAARWDVHITTVYRWHRNDPTFGVMLRPGLLRISMEQVLEREETERRLNDPVEMARVKQSWKEYRATLRRERQRRKYRPKGWVDLFADC